MPEYPLLLFPEQNPGVRAKRGSGPSKIKIPGAQKQATRLAPQFQRLQQAMDRQRLMLQNNALGIQPEQTLVLETVGPVEDFVKAVSKINGLEWLGEFEIDDIAPDHRRLAPAGEGALHPPAGMACLSLPDRTTPRDPDRRRVAVGIN